MKVLVVDDSAVMRKFLVDALLKTGIHNVGQASNGEAAVAAVMEGNFDLVLMDWNMPKMDGLEAVREIRAKGNNVPIIMVTTESEKSRILDALKSGANNYIVKPFTAELVAKKIRETMSK